MIAKVLLVAIIATGLASGQVDISGVRTPNSDGSESVNVQISKSVGEPEHNVKIGATVSGNSKSNTPTVGAIGQVNVDEHSLSIVKSFTPGESETFSQNARVNILKDDNVRLDANLFNSHTSLNNGFEFDKRGGSLDFLHRQGHSVSVGANHIPQIGGTTADILGKANLWKSNSGRTTFDVTGTASRTFGGPFDGQNNFGGGVLFRHTW